MRRTAIPLAAACTLMAGCFTMNRASTDALRSSRLLETDGKPMEHVVVSNYGWYLFNHWPIACGNAKTGAKFPWAFFDDEVNADVMHSRLTAYAAERKADVADVNLIFDDRVIIEVPGTQIPIMIPYLISYRERIVSAVLVEPPTAADSKRVRQRQLRREMDELLNRIPKDGQK